MKLFPSRWVADLPVEEPLLRRNGKRFRGGLVFKAHRLLSHSTLGLGEIKKKKVADLPVDERKIHVVFWIPVVHLLEGFGFRVSGLGFRF